MPTKKALAINSGPAETFLELSSQCINKPCFQNQRGPILNLLQNFKVMNGINSLFRGKSKFFSQNHSLKHRKMNFLVLLHLTLFVIPLNLKVYESCKARKSPRHAW